MKKKPYFSKKGDSEDFNYLGYHIKLSILLIPVLLILFFLYELAHKFGFI